MQNEVEDDFIYVKNVYFTMPASIEFRDRALNQLLSNDCRVYSVDISKYTHPLSNKMSLGFRKLNTIYDDDDDGIDSVQSVSKAKVVPEKKRKVPNALKQLRDKRKILDTKVVAENSSKSCCLHRKTSSVAPKTVSKSLPTVKVGNHNSASKCIIGQSSHKSSVVSKKVVDKPTTMCTKSEFLQSVGDKKSSKTVCKPTKKNEIPVTTSAMQQASKNAKKNISAEEIRKRDKCNELLLELFSDALTESDLEDVHRNKETTRSKSKTKGCLTMSQQKTTQTTSKIQTKTRKPSSSVENAKNVKQTKFHVHQPRQPQRYHSFNTPKELKSHHNVMLVQATVIFVPSRYYHANVEYCADVRNDACCVKHLCNIKAEYKQIPETIDLTSEDTPDYSQYTCYNHNIKEENQSETHTVMIKKETLVSINVAASGGIVDLTAEDVQTEQESNNALPEGVLPIKNEASTVYAGNADEVTPPTCDGGVPLPSTSVGTNENTFNSSGRIQIEPQITQVPGVAEDILFGHRNECRLELNSDIIQELFGTLYSHYATLKHYLDYIKSCPDAQQHLQFKVCRITVDQLAQELFELLWVAYKYVRNTIAFYMDYLLTIRANPLRQDYSQFRDLMLKFTHERRDVYNRQLFDIIAKLEVPEFQFDALLALISQKIQERVGATKIGSVQLCLTLYAMLVPKPRNVVLPRFLLVLYSTTLMAMRRTLHIIHNGERRPLTTSQQQSGQCITQPKPRYVFTQNQLNMLVHQIHLYRRFVQQYNKLCLRLTTAGNHPQKQCSSRSATTSNTPVLKALLKPTEKTKTVDVNVQNRQASTNPEVPLVHKSPRQSVPTPPMESSAASSTVEQQTSTSVNSLQENRESCATVSAESVSNFKLSAEHCFNFGVDLIQSLASNEKTAATVEKNTNGHGDCDAYEEEVIDVGDFSTVIDLTWIDDADPASVRNELNDLITVKMEKDAESDPPEDNKRHIQICAASPVDSGLGSPVHNVTSPVDSSCLLNDNPQCLCGKTVAYICPCEMASYCSMDCQMRHWSEHQKLCRSLR